MPTRWRWSWTAILRGGLISLALLAGGPAPATRAEDNAAVFDRAWSMTQRRFWNPAMNGADWAAARERHRPAAVAAWDETALYEAINTMLDELHDSHSFATSPSERRQMRDRARGDAAAGFGLDLAPVTGGWQVATVTPGGPAARAGVLVGWTLLAIDGRPPDGVREFGAGDRAVLRFADDAGRARDFALTGVELPPQSARRSRMLAGGVLLLAFDGFDPGTDRWIAGEIATARPTGVLLDLRENDGGDSGTLDRVAGLFFAERRVVLRLVRRKESEERTIGAGGRDGWTGPLALLVGPRSASAAEALAAMIDEAGRGQTVGERTAGALTGAAEYGLPDGGALSIAEHDVRTPAGRRLEGAGLSPRHVVVPTLAERRRGADPVAECGRRLVLGQACDASPAARPPLRSAS